MGGLGAMEQLQRASAFASSNRGQLALRRTAPLWRRAVFVCAVTWSMGWLTGAKAFALPDCTVSSATWCKRVVPDTQPTEYTIDFTLESPALVSPGSAGAADGAGGSRTKFGSFRFTQKPGDSSKMVCSGTAKGTKLTKLNATTSVKMLVWNSDVCGPNVTLGPSPVSAIPNCQ